MRKNRFLNQLIKTDLYYYEELGAYYDSIA